MRKYENVDIIAALGAVMEVNTEHYKSDFRYDIEKFREAVATPDAENVHLLWMSRPSGTWSFRERDVYVKGTSANNTWSFYADTRDTILAYAVEITGRQGGKVLGNLYELDYKRHVQEVNRLALPPVDVTLFLADGSKTQLPYEEYNTRWIGLVDRYGPIQRVRFEVADEGVIQQAMRQARNERQKNNPAVFKLRNSNRKPSVLARLHESKAVAAQGIEVSKTAPKRDTGLEV